MFLKKSHQKVPRYFISCKIYENTAWEKVRAYERKKKEKKCH
jgi:hypothetical protein